jgi:hypothetical protein
MEMALGLRRRQWEGTPSLSPGMPTHEPLEEPPCSITTTEVAREEREQGWKKGDDRVGHHGSGYKGPQGGLSTPMAFNASPIRQPPYSSPDRAASVSRRASGRQTVSRRRHMVHLIMTSESCERAGFAPFIFSAAALMTLSLKRFNSPWVSNVA